MRAADDPSELALRAELVPSRWEGNRLVVGLISFRGLVLHNGAPNDPASATSSSFSSSGILTFNGSGHGHAKIALVGLDHPPFPAADGQLVTFPFSYNVANSAVTLSAAR